jgi:hypothetical protein
MNKDVGYFIYHNCKCKNCVFFPQYDLEIGRYYTPLDNKDYECRVCEGCETFKRAMGGLK